MVRSLSRLVATAASCGLAERIGGACLSEPRANRRPVILGPNAADRDDVNGSQTTLLPDGTGLSTTDETWASRWVAWIVAARSHRVICLVMGIWLLNGFDLVFTLLSYKHGLLQEQNPLARLVLGNGTSSIVLFKVGLVFIGSYPLLRFRRTRIAELASYLVVVAYVLLAIRWSTCFELYAAALPGDIGLAELQDFDVTATH